MKHSVSKKEDHFNRLAGQELQKMQHKLVKATVKARFLFFIYTSERSISMKYIENTLVFQGRSTPEYLLTSSSDLCGLPAAVTEKQKKKTTYEL